MLPDVRRISSNGRAQSHPGGPQPNQAMCGQGGAADLHPSRGGVVLVCSHSCSASHTEWEHTTAVRETHKQSCKEKNTRCGLKEAHGCHKLPLHPVSEAFRSGYAIFGSPCKLLPCVH